MNVNCKTAMVSGAVGGYVLGRTKKAKLALVLASLLMGRRLGLRPQELIKKGAEKLAEIPQFAELGDRVREDLMTAARAAFTSTLNRRIDGISDSVRQRTENFVNAKKEESAGKSPDKTEGEESPGPEGKGREGTRDRSGKGEPAQHLRSPEKRAKRREQSRSEGLSRR